MNQSLDANGDAERTVNGALAPRAEPEETLHTVIADQARSRSPGELWTTAIGGGVNAMLIWSQFPALHWLAAGFAGVAAYGAWGLLDRAIRTLILKDENDRGAIGLLKLLRGTAGAGGWIAALTAVAMFLTAALGALSKPGG